MTSSLILYQMPPIWGLPNMSPYCVKLETYLRMTGIEYQVRRSNFLKAPRGRVPYVRFDGELMGDTTLIIERLMERYGDRLDAGLSARQKAEGLAVQRMLEDHLFRCMAWFRWHEPASWAYVREALLRMMPPVLGGVLLSWVRRSFVREQGLGEFTREEIAGFARADFLAISELLGEKKYFFGDEPHSIDAVLYGFLVQILGVPWSCPVKEYVKALPNLESYVQRMKARYWS